MATGETDTTLMDTPEFEKVIDGNEPSGFEISPQQRRIWQYQGQMAPLCTQESVEISGDLDVVALKAAIDRAVSRHEILRTTFHRVPGRMVPVQVVHDDLRPAWREIDLTRLDGADQALKLRESGEADREIDLAEGPILQITLCQLAAKRYRLIVTMPSLCADSETMAILMQEIAQEMSGGLSHENGEPLQYADVADWLNQLLEDPNPAEPGYAFWKQISLDSQHISLPFEREPDASSSFCTARIEKRLDSATAGRLRNAAESHKLSPAAIAAANWQILLSRLSGNWGLDIYHITSGRPDADLKGALGPLAKVLPASVVINATFPSVRIWRRVAKAAQETDVFQHFYNGAPEGEHGTDRGPQYVFRYEGDERAYPVRAGNAEFTFLPYVSDLGPFDIQLLVHERTNDFSLEFLYDARRFAESDIQRLADYYITLLRSGISNPDAPVGTLAILPEDERNQILAAFNDSQKEFPSTPSVHKLFEAWAHKTPDAPAVVFEDHSLTYEELNARANQLARCLKKRGVGRDTIVGLCTERSVEMVVGLLGILKAGGAYLPLDPALPAGRLSDMLADSGTSLVVSQSSLMSLLESSAGVILMDKDAPEIAGESPEDLPDADLKSALVYVIYTSGSTGKPKAVGIEHQQLLNYVRAVSERLNLPTGSHYASVSTISADLGNTSVYGALCSGGCLHVISQDCSMDPALWRSYLKKNAIDCLKIVPSHLSALLGRGEHAHGEVGSEMLPRRVLVLGGEACRWELVERVQALSANLQVFNHYGPTETTVGTLTYAVARDAGKEKVGSQTVPLGRPLANTQAYVLNEYLDPVPIGVAGELYIGGRGVGRGYLNRPELTEERFVKNPFSSVDSARLYKTGDVCRQLADGSVEYIGRIDNQVKIRGYRIELGEVETVLLSHAGVREAVVVAREDESGEKRLAGYVVGQGGSVDVAALKEHMRQHLPEYMVPPWIGVLNRLPLTANGKIDRAALPSPEALSEGHGYVAPRSAVEELLVEIWEELLRRDKVGVTDNFFELGGHSLLATQVISRVRETFEVDIPLRALFEAPTISSFAEAMLADEEARPGIEQMASVLVSLSGLSEDELEERLSQLSAEGASEWK